MRRLLIVLAVLVVLFLAWSSVYSVDRAEYVYVTQFGRHIATLDGETDGGLHLKSPWPIQSVQRIDRRLQAFDLPETELLTHDSEGKTIDKTLSVVAFVTWRIADAEGVDRFIRRMGTPDQARRILGDRVRSQLGGLIGKKRMDDLINTDPAVVTRNLEELHGELLHQPGADKVSLAEWTKTQYGIELVDVRLRRTSHPLAVRDSIFDRIRSERAKRVADYQSEGARRAENIKSDAERAAREIVAKAKADEQKIKGDAEAEADKIRNAAQSKDTEFYAFLKKLDEYQKILGDNKTMLLLSSHGELFDVFFKPPKPGNGGTPVKEPMKDDSRTRGN